MFSIGLTGGIGSGKTAVSDRLAERGAWVIDADIVAREVVEPGGPAYEPLVERFGSGILDADGLIVRQALADIAFSSPEELEALNAITHPTIGIEMIERQKALEGTDALVVLAIPLLRQVHRETMTIDRVVVVDCPVDVAVERLVSFRGFSERDARARIDAQITREERRRDADFIVVNDAGVDRLEVEVDRLWSWLTDQRGAS